MSVPPSAPFFRSASSLPSASASFRPAARSSSTYSVKIATSVVLGMIGGWGSAANAQTVTLSPVFVTAARSVEPAGDVPFSHATLTGDEMRAAPNVSVDGALRAIPGFSLFRRSDSIVANPTTQGVSLRGLGPSGASRSLVLLDGVPLNDPFGGWVLWSQVPRESLAQIEIVPGGGGTAWGDAALGGVIQLFTEPLVGQRARFSARAGSFETQDVEFQATAPAGRGTVQLLGRYFSTDGYYVVAPENRGSIDTPASSRARWLTARWREPLGAGLTATLTVRRFAEDRGNGTPYQRNGTDETFASVEVENRASAAFRWTATAYAEDESYSSTFSSVNSTRTAETPASNQFDVPATALGAAWVGEWTGAGDAHTTFGFDARDVRGETREDSGYTGGAFTRRRFAGGRQTIAGVFIEHSRPIAGDLHGTVGLRADRWWETDGHRRDFLNGAPAGETAYPDRDGTTFSPSAGLVWPVNEHLRLHANAQHAFRRPTLNELYRPFRVGNVITDANPDLRTETVTSGELGATLDVGRSLPTPETAQSAGPQTRDLPSHNPPPLTLDFAIFGNELHDAVSNVTIAEGPANVPGIGVIPAGGQGRRRLNLDRVRVQGITANARWRLVPGLALDVQYLLDDTEVVRASVAPQLEGLRLAQVPRQSASAGLSWRTGRWSLAPRVRWIGAQFEDDQNTLRLGPAVVCDLSAGFTLRAGAELFLSAENIFDERIETGRSADGLVNTGTPRLLLAGFRWSR